MHQDKRPKAGYIKKIITNGGGSGCIGGGSGDIIPDGNGITVDGITKM
jgi:hypothetical protein